MPRPPTTRYQDAARDADASPLKLSATARRQATAQASRVAARERVRVLLPFTALAPVVWSEACSTDELRQLATEGGPVAMPDDIAPPALVTLTNAPPFTLEPGELRALQRVARRVRRAVVVCADGAPLVTVQP